MVGGSIVVAAGLRLWQMALLLIPMPFVAEFAFHHLHDYQRARITTFLNPESDPLGAGYNIIQSKIALGSGGLWGKGFLQGTQGHLDFLPEKQTDFIFTMIAEEFGLVGSLAVIAPARHHRPRRHGDRAALPPPIRPAAGARHRRQLLHVCFVNLAMVMGAIPVGGVPLPLVSHGGSAMLTVMFGFGLLMSVHVHRDTELGEHEE